MTRARSGGIPAKDRLVFPLDVARWSEAEALVSELHAHVGVFKVGLELFTAVGPSAVTQLATRGLKVFLDLKLHDIPSTVAGAVESALGLGATYLTVHASAGREALRQAARLTAGTPLTLLGVTVLTEDEWLTLIGE